VAKEMVLREGNNFQIVSGIRIIALNGNTCCSFFWTFFWFCWSLLDTVNQWSRRGALVTSRLSVSSVLSDFRGDPTTTSNCAVAKTVSDHCQQQQHNNIQQRFSMSDDDEPGIFYRDVRYGLLTRKDRTVNAPKKLTTELAPLPDPMRLPIGRPPLQLDLTASKLFN
jgi:hypothetical protein